MKLKHKDARIIDTYHVMCPYCLQVKYVGELPIYMAKLYGSQLTQCSECKRFMNVRWSKEEE